MALVILLRFLKIYLRQLITKKLFSEPIIETHDRDFGCHSRSLVTLKFWNLMYMGKERSSLRHVWYLVHCWNVLLLVFILYSHSGTFLGISYCVLDSFLPEYQSTPNILVWCHYPFSSIEMIPSPHPLILLWLPFLLLYNGVSH